MKKNFLILLLFTTSFSFAQSEDKPKSESDKNKSRLELYLEEGFKDGTIMLHFALAGKTEILSTYSPESILEYRDEDNNENLAHIVAHACQVKTLRWLYKNGFEKLLDEKNVIGLTPISILRTCYR